MRGTTRWSAQYGTERARDASLRERLWEDLHSAWGSRYAALAGSILAAAIMVLGALPGVALAAAPASVPAYYIYGTSASAVEQAAYNDGCSFAKANPGGERLLMLDFGAARANASGAGTVDFSNYSLSNPTILSALESASNGANACYKQGINQIAYGNSNDTMTQAGMSATDATNAGQYQAQREDDLENYLYSTNRQNTQDTAVGVDMEPGFDLRPISNALVNGINKDAQQIGFDYGSADGCPQSGSGGSCNNGWIAHDVAYASFSGLMEPMPEIYYSPNASQWTVIRKSWTGTSPSYYFSGVTGESSGAGLTPQQGFDALSADNPGLVSSAPGIICFGC